MIEEEAGRNAGRSRRSSKIESSRPIEGMTNKMAIRTLVESTSSPTSNGPSVPMTSQTDHDQNATSNALLLRISKVLTTCQFDDPSTRVALEILNSLTYINSPNSSSSPPSSSSISPSSEIDYLQTLKKGGLRRIVEQRIRTRSREFLNVFSELNDNLIDLQSHLDQMQECCDEVEEKLKVANSSTKYLLEHADGLRSESQSVATKQLLAKAFLHRFTLTEAEILALTSREIHVNKHLFEAMDHCERIRSDCSALLTSDLNSKRSETAGLDIMQATSKYLDKGYEKILKWTLLECRTGFVKLDERHPDVNSFIKRAISRLKRRPESLDEVINTLSTTRSGSLLTLFLEALTRGGPSGVPRPIELNAHDPIRYIGDMLAWIHQVMASEYEFLESLFDLKSDGRRVGESRILPTNPSSTAEETQPQADHNSGGGQATSSELTIINSKNPAISDRQLVRKLVDKHLEGCIRPLKMRVQQTVNSQEGSLIACQLANLLEFYYLTMAGTIGPDAKLTETLSELTSQSYEVFYQLLKSLSVDYLRHLEPPPVDLSVPPTLHEALSNLSVIMSIYDGPTEESKSEHSFERVLELIIGPMLEVIDNMARLRASEWDQSIFWLNCLESMLTTFDGSDLTHSAVERLDNLRQTHLEKLIQQYTAHLVSVAGLESVLKAIETKDKDTPLSRIEEANSKSISEALKRFDQFLMNVDTSLTSNKFLSLLTSSSASITLTSNKDEKPIEFKNLKEAVLKTSLSRLISNYETIYSHVLDPQNRFEFKSTLLIRSLDEVQTLIGF